MSKAIASASAVSSGMGFFSALTVLLIALKITGLSSMSWFWTLIWFFGPVLLILGGICIFIIILLIISLYDGYKFKKKRKKEDERRANR